MTIKINEIKKAVFEGAFPRKKLVGYVVAYKVGGYVVDTLSHAILIKAAMRGGAGFMPFMATGWADAWPHL